MWMLHQLDPGSAVANVAVGLECDAYLDSTLLGAVVESVIARHPELRSAFTEQDGVPVRRIRDLAELDVTVEVQTAAYGDELDEAMRAFVARPFDLERDLLLRVGLWLLGDGCAVLFTAHHVVFDGRSAELLVEEVAFGYESMSAGHLGLTLPSAPDLGAPAEPRADEVRYWQTALAGMSPDRSPLSGARPDPERPTFRGSLVSRSLSPAASNALATLRHRSRASDNVVLLALFAVALQRHGADPRLAIGLPVDLRTADTLRAIGYHVNTLPILTGIDLGLGMESAVQHTRDAVLLGLQHRDTAVDGLSLAPHGQGAGAWRTSLFRYLFTYIPRTSRDAWIGGGAARQIERRRWHHGVSRLDLELYVEHFEKSLVLSAAFSTEVLDRPYVEAFLARMEQLLLSAAEHPDRPLRSLDFWTAADRAVTAPAGSSESAPGPGLLNRWTTLAAADPGAPAVEVNGTVITRRALDRAAGELCDRLIDAGVKPGDVVALRMRRGPALAAADLAVWAAGAAFLALSPDGVPVHATEQCEDAGVVVLVSDDGLADANDWWSDGRPHLIAAEPGPAESLPGGVGEPHAVGESDERQGLDGTRPGAVAGPESLAYVIFTSGTTGRPKGVRVRHGELESTIAAMADLLGPEASRRTAWTTVFTFDVSVLELVLPLVRGHVLLPFAEPVGLEQDATGSLWNAAPTLVQATPTVWRLLLPSLARDALAGVTTLCGGEPLTSDLAAALAGAGARLFNVYGPTEATVWATGELVEDPTDITVGRPLTGRRAYVLDAAREPLPPGLPGEVWLAGSLAEGYAGRPQETADRFVRHPLLGRVYRTGDLGSWGFDGRLRLAGRNDRQVKVRGTRIELDAVEASLLTHPDVLEVAVVRRGTGLEASLAGFIRTGSAETDPTEIRSWLRGRLPEAAVPSSLRLVDRLPRTANDKLDRRALEAMETADPATPIPADDTEPEGAVEPTVEALIRLWAALLEHPEPGPHTHFFDAGGHSLLAARLSARVRAATGLTLSLRDVYEAPTPALLAARLAEFGQDDAAGEASR
jgi:amino acid adenylation domain-containing protein